MHVPHEGGRQADSGEKVVEEEITRLESDCGRTMQRISTCSLGYGDPSKDFLIDRS